MYLQYVERLWSFARRYVRTDDGAEDVVHDVFLAIWARRAAWDPADVEGYLFRAVLNRALQVGRHAGIVSRSAGELTAYRRAGGDPAAPDADVEQRSDEEWLARAIAELPERARIAIRLRWYDEMSYGQIAHVLGVSEDAARMYVRRALVVVRELLERG